MIFSVSIVLQCIILNVNSETLQLNELSEIVKQLQAENLHMKKAIEVLQKDIKILKSENNGLINEITVLRKNEHMHNDNYDTTEGVDDTEMNDDLTTLSHQKRFLIPTRETTIHSIETTKSPLSTPNPTSTSGIKTTKAAFTAFLNSPIDWSMSDKEYTAVFDSVVSNIGTGYEPTTGVFTAQAKGTYYFFSSLKSGGNYFNEIYFVLNNNTVCSWNKGTDESGSVATVISLDVGDRVYVQYYLWRKDYSNNWYSASFSGFQI